MIVYGVLTYDDRYEVLSKTLSCLSDFETIICHNGCSQPCLTYSSNNIILNENLGSSGGYGAIIRRFLSDYKCGDFLVLLDDDNCVDLEFHKNLMLNIDEGLEIGGSFRASRAKSKSIYHKKSYRYFEEDNYFGLNIFKRNSYDQGYLGVAPYGGLAISHEILSVIGLPDKKYFVYGDDIEYTLRLKKIDRRIKFLEDCIIYDQFSSTCSEDTSHRYFQGKISKELLGYQLLNHKKVSYVTKSTYRFYVNKFLFLLIIIWKYSLSKSSFSQLLFVFRRVL